QSEPQVEEDHTEMAPEIIVLDDEEKFKDNLGNMCEIETRGTRDPRGIYFKVADVASSFGMANLHQTIIDNRNNGYFDGIHYKYFYLMQVGRANTKQIKVKKLFLTYLGILRVLFASKSDKVNNFVNWAVETLFTVQMGTLDSKMTLSSKLLGVE